MTNTEYRNLINQIPGQIDTAGWEHIVNAFTDYTDILDYRGNVISTITYGEPGYVHDGYCPTLIFIDEEVAVAYPPEPVQLSEYELLKFLEEE